MHDKILSIIRSKGPILPAQLVRPLETDTTMVGAYLSELVAHKKLLYTHLKIGASPLYYLKEQKEKLQEFYKNLNDKDKKAFDLLKSKKVLMDKELNPLIRVALRNIKDFAVPLNVKVNGSAELFWKWYILSDEEAKPIIQSYLDKAKKIQEKESEAGKKQREDRIMRKREEENRIKREQEELRKREAKEKELLKREEELKKTESRKIEELEEKEKLLKEKETAMRKQQQEILQQQKLVGVEKEKIEEKEVKEEELQDSFLEQIRAFFADKNIEIISSNIIRKKLEIDLVVKVPNVIGSVEYYCKAKNKKRCGEGDLSAAFVQGQIKKLPTLFITTGDLTKKANAMLDKEFRNSLLFKKVE